MNGENGWMNSTKGVGGKWIKSARRTQGKGTNEGGKCVEMEGRREEHLTEKWIIR
jgi:hypothetical protein